MKARALTAATLRRWPLPEPDPAGSKEARGRVLVAGGAEEMPGAIILAANAALRAGAGKLQIATVAKVHALVAAQIPECRARPLPEAKDGALHPKGAKTLAEWAEPCAAVLIGPGMLGDSRPFMKAFLAAAREPEYALVADAEALCSIEGDLSRFDGRAILTPHAGEMARLLELEKEEVEADPRAAAHRAAERLGAVVVMKGARTWIVSPDGDAYRNDAGNVGLGVSGSGDVLAGIAAGLLARGAEPLQAALFAVHLHARAGERLAQQVGPIGYLPRELLPQIPRLLADLAR